MEAENQHLIEAFFDESLSESEKLVFEKRLQEDPEFKSLVDDYRQAVWMLKIQRHLDLRTEVDTLAEARENTLNKDTVSSAEEPIYSINEVRWAAVFVTLCITSLLYFFISQRYSNAGLTKHYFDPYTSHEDTAKLKRAKSFLINNFDKGLAHYEQNRYDSAIVYFESIVGDTTNYQEAQLYLANSYIAIGTPSEAEKILVPLRDLKMYQSVVNWYLGLAKLGRSDVIGARQLFQEIHADSSDRRYQVKAGEILDQLNHKIRSLPGVP